MREITIEINVQTIIIKPDKSISPMCYTFGPIDEFTNRDEISTYVVNLINKGVSFIEGKYYDDDDKTYYNTYYLRLDEAQSFQYKRFIGIGLSEIIKVNITMKCDRRNIIEYEDLTDNKGKLI